MLTSQPIGPIGAWEGWAQTIASLLGWDGSGSPLADVTLPVIPTDFLDGSTIPAARPTDLSSLVARPRCRVLIDRVNSTRKRQPLNTTFHTKGIRT